MDNKTTFCGTSRADMFDTLSVDNIRSARAEVRRSKTRFYAEIGEEVCVACVLVGLHVEFN